MSIKKQTNKKETLFTCGNSRLTLKGDLYFLASLKAGAPYLKTHFREQLATWSQEQCDEPKIKLPSVE